MNLVMIIQKVDEEDSVFGANISWIKSLAACVEKLFVIGLSVNRYTLPSNTTVYSLGKERGYGRLRRVFRLEWIMMKIYLKHGIDGVFVHQGQIYGPLLVHFKLLGIPFVLFKAHGSLPPNIRYFLPFFDKITTTTPETFPIDTPKKVPVGQGIDVERFRFVGQRGLKSRDKPRNVIISTGRISPIKGYDVLIDAASILHKELEPSLRFEVYGEAYVQTDKAYERQLKQKIVDCGLMGRFFLMGAVLSSDLPERLSGSILFVDASTGNSALNKGILEAMACEIPVLSANEKFIPLFAPYVELLTYRRGDAVDLAQKIKAYLELDDKQKRTIGARMRQVVVKDHNVFSLMGRIITIFEETRRS